MRFWNFGIRSSYIIIIELSLKLLIRNGYFWSKNYGTSSLSIVFDRKWSIVLKVSWQSIVLNRIPPFQTSESPARFTGLYFARCTLVHRYPSIHPHYPKELRWYWQLNTSPKILQLQKQLLRIYAILKLGRIISIYMTVKVTLSFFLCEICTNLMRCLSGKSVTSSLYSQDMDHLIVTWSTGPSILFCSSPMSAEWLLNWCTFQRRT